MAKDDAARRAQAVQAHIEFEEDPHRAAVEDNPAEIGVGYRTWLAIFVGSPSPRSWR